MNRNTIMSLSMIYALWQAKHQDLLDLIKPFVLFSVGNTTKVGSCIDVDNVCRYLESEFGYKSFQPAVVNKVLKREASASSTTTNPNIVRKNRVYVLQKSYAELIEKFSEKRINCKAHSDSVTSALAEYLNKNNVYRRRDYSQQDAERILLSFFERRGSTILLSIDDLSQQMAKNDECDYFVGKFILTQSEQKTVIMDYITELVKGYYVTTALYLQAENTDVTRASFSDATFFLDTRILLGYLGYKTQQENDSIQEMVQSLKKSGAKLACFSYNEDEVESILDAYRQSTIFETKHSPYTLEYFDSLGRNSTPVEAAIKYFRGKLKDEGIISVDPAQILDQNELADSAAGLLNDSVVKDILTSIRPAYNFDGFPEDMTAINTVSRLRKGQKLPYIEKCKAVFVTNNTALIAAVNRYLKENSIDYGFPVIISGDEMCVLAWLKDFESDNDLPQMRLLENVMAAVSPSPELMDAFYANLDNLEQQGKIDDEELALLRIDQYSKKELMELTGGNSQNVTTDVVEKIRKKIRDDSFAEGVSQGKILAATEYQSKQQSQRNIVCKRAEQEVEKKYSDKEHRHIITIKITAVFFALLFIVAAFISFFSQWNNSLKIPLIVLTIFTTVEGAWPFFCKDNFLIRLERKRLAKKKLKEIDLRKEEYLSIIDSASEE